MREKIKTLEFKKIEAPGNYASIAFKAFDGGHAKISFNPFELNVISVADSNGNKKFTFIYPKFDKYTKNKAYQKSIENFVNGTIGSQAVIQKFVELLGFTKLTEVSYVIKNANANAVMEIAEWSFIFNKITSGTDEPTIVLKDGLLRSKILKDTEISKLINLAEANKKFVKLVGVSKTSKIMSMLATALFMDGKIPSDAIAYVKIPLELELMAYKWSGHGEISEDKALDYAFGSLYIAKLSKHSNLLTTLEIPKDLKNNRDIYTEEEINEIISYLAKDSSFSYPNIGYPQTLMKAHEVAAEVGFPLSITRDEIKDRILEILDDEKAKEYIKSSEFIIDSVNKGVLGGGRS